MLGVPNGKGITLVLGARCACSKGFVHQKTSRNFKDHLKLMRVKLFGDVHIVRSTCCSVAQCHP